MLRALAFAGLVIVFFSGCYQVGPDYEKPDLKVPDKWRFNDANPTALSKIDAIWWRQFKDPILNNLIETAIQNNLDLQAAIGRVEAFMGVYGSVRSMLFPQIYGTGTINKINNANNQIALSGGNTTAPGTIDFARMGGTMAWEIDVWGQLRRAKESARSELLAQESFRSAVMLTVVTQVALTYIQLRLLDSDLEITQRIMGLLKNELKISESRFKEGYTSKLDLDQIQSEYHRRASRVPDYEKQIAETEHALCLLLGRPPGPIPRGKTLDDLPELTVPAGIPADVVRQRPDVQQAEYNLIASNARIGYALGEYFPKIVLTGDAGQATTQLSNMFTPGANFWSIGSGLVMPIFTAGKIAGRVQEAEGAMTTSKADYIKSVLTAFKEVDDALVAKIKTKEQLLEETERVKANQSYFKLSKLRYDEGYEDYLVVLDALRQLFEAEIERASIKQNNLSAAIKIYRAMGGGWVGKTEKDTKVQQPTEASFLP